MRSSNSIWKGLFCVLFVAFYIYSMLNSVAFSKGSDFTIFANAAVFLFLLYFTFVHVRIQRFYFIYLYILFLLVLILLTSSDYSYSIKMWVKYTMGLLCLPLGFEMFTDRTSVNYLWHMIQVLLILFIVNYYLANLYGWGEVQYREGISIGNMFDSSLHTNICILILLPLFFLYRMRGRLLVLLLILIAASLVIVTMKRTAIACLVLAALSFSILIVFRLRHGKVSAEKKHLKMRTIYILAVVAVFSGFVIYFYPIIKQTYLARVAVLERQGGFQNEGRVRELVYIADDIFNSEDIDEFLFGKETFNTVGTYAEGAFGDRMIHDNFGIIINGTGVVGLLIYVLLDLYFLFAFFRYSRRVSFKDNQEARLLYTIYVALWLTYNVASLSGTIWQTIYPMFNFLILGMILRYFYEYGKVGYSINLKTE